MKRKIIVSILIIIIIVLTVYDKLEVDYIKKEPYESTINMEHEIKLQTNCKLTDLPYINLVGKVEEKDAQYTKIAFEGNEKEYLETKYIAVDNRFDIEEGKEVIIRLKEVVISGDKISYENSEIYKEVEIAERKNEKKSSFYMINRVGRFEEVKGTEFEYKGNKYFEKETESSTKIKYYEDVNDGTLLCESYKNIWFPMKW